MSLDFPSSPTVGQQYGGYVYDGTKWKVSTTSTAPAAVQPTPPTNPTVGDMWFNSTDGTMYFYYNDGSTAQWVESRAPIVANGYYSPNYVINGGMDIWQRGTSIGANNQTVWTADRWIIQTGSTATTSRQSTGLAGFQYCARIQRNSGVTSTSSLSLGQPLETIMSIPLAGKTVTLSWYARAGANFSAASSILSMALITGTGTDQNRLISGYTGETVVTNASYTLTTSWQRFSVTVTLPSNTNEITVNPYYVPTGTAGAADYYELTGVQLEEGSVATTFRRNANSVAEELLSCQRYYVRLNQAEYETTFGTGVQTGTSNGNVFVPLPTTLRVPPTLVTFSSVWAGDKSTVSMVATSTASYSNTNSLTLAITYSAFGAQFRPLMLQGKGTPPYNSYIEVHAEL